MDLLKRWKSALFVDNGLMFSVVLIVIGAFTWSRFIDWSGPLDDMPDKDRAALESCIMAERSLGDGIYLERPDCRKILETARAMAAAPRSP